MRKLLPKTGVENTSIQHTTGTPNSMSKPKSTVKSQPASKTKGRTNIALRHPCILAAHQAAVRLGLIRAKSTSEWVEDVMTKAVRSLSPKLRRLVYRLPADKQEEVRDGITVANIL